MIGWWSASGRKPRMRLPQYSIGRLDDYLSLASPPATLRRLFRRFSQSIFVLDVASRLSDSTTWRDSVAIESPYGSAHSAKVIAMSGRAVEAPVTRRAVLDKTGTITLVTARQPCSVPCPNVKEMDLPARRSSRLSRTKRRRGAPSSCWQKRRTTCAAAGAAHPTFIPSPPDPDVRCGHGRK